MAVTALQSEVLKLLAARRRSSGEICVARGVALTELLRAPRRSRDIDLFHDSNEALASSVRADLATLRASRMELEVVHESPAFVEVNVRRDGASVLLQWLRESAFRFFPLVEDEQLGLALHPFDLATNKVLAMGGRLEARDWIDVLTCDEKLQPLGYLVWAACGKDPGYNPKSLLAEISRAHYSQAELNALDFEGARPNAAALGARWHAALREAVAICSLLPVEHVGECVLTRELELERRASTELTTALRSGAVSFHAGRLSGSWPSARTD